MVFDIDFTPMRKQIMGFKPEIPPQIFRNEGEKQMKVYFIFFIWEDATNVDMHFYVENLKVLCNSCSK